MRVVGDEIVVELPNEVRELLERFEDLEIDDNAKPSLLVLKLKKIKQSKPFSLRRLPS